MKEIFDKIKTNTIILMFFCILLPVAISFLHHSKRYDLREYKNLLKEKNDKIEEYKKAEKYNLAQFKKLKDLAINTSVQLKSCSEYVKVKENN